MAKKSGTKKRTAPSAPKGFVILKDVVSMFRLPPTLKSEDAEKTTNVKVVTTYDIQEKGFAETTAKTMSLTKETLAKTKKFFVEPYDVIISAAGTIGKTAIIPETLKGNIFPITTLLVIRFHENKEESAIALLLYLKSAAGQKVIRKMITGKSIKILNIGSMAKMVVPELSADVKKKALSTFKKIQGLHQKIEDTKTAISELEAGYWT